jgi:hypothetical protein
MNIVNENPEIEGIESKVRHRSDSSEIKEHKVTADGEVTVTSFPKNDIAMIIVAQSKYEEYSRSLTSQDDDKIALYSGNDENANLANESFTSSSKKGVVFDESVQVILIPSRSEFERLSLCSSLWWSSCELRQFPIQAYQDIKKLAHDEDITLKDARKKLYEPVRYTLQSIEKYVAHTTQQLVDRNAFQETFQNNRIWQSVVTNVPLQIPRLLRDDDSARGSGSDNGNRKNRNDTSYGSMWHLLGCGVAIACISTVIIDVYSKK